MKRLLMLYSAVVLLAMTGPAMAAPAIRIVAAENFYGDVARQLGGADVEVSSILTNPSQDPHLFEASPSVARAISTAHIVIYNGIGYDPWIEKLMAAVRGAGRQTIVVADLVGKKAGDNPHIWYDPKTMSALAKALATALIAADPGHKADYERRLARFRQSLQPIQARIATLRQRLAGVPVTATEPVFGYLFDALGVTVRNHSFQRAVMNGTEPGASEVAAFERDLVAQRVRLLVYNRQASSPMAERMLKLAGASHVPVVGATETEPPGKSYQAWMLDELDAVDRAIPE
jgi:zinc/manganese transport system substrate-binding protein